MSKNAYFRLNAVGEIPATYASLVLQRIEDAYVGLWIILELSKKNPVAFSRAVRSIQINSQHSVWIPDDSVEISALELRGVVLQSPGFWEFLGKLNPLEVIRTYLNDRHERAKDNNYRNRMEEEKLSIENSLARVKLISEFVAAAERAGMPKQELTAIVRDNAYIPLMRLNALQDKGIISTAVIAENKKQEHREVQDA